MGSTSIRKLFSHKEFGLLSHVFLVGMLASGFAATPVWAQENVDTITVIGDPVGLAEQEPTESVFGISKSLLETPRSVSVLSDVTIERYQLDTISDLVTVAPNTFTGTRFGVTGQLTVRGSDAENFFRGFKRVENVNSYPTPVGGARRLEVIRGPLPPIYGAGKVGGMLNFIPRTARIGNEGLIDDVQGEVSLGLGSFDKKKASGEIAVPFALGWDIQGGFSTYIEHQEDGDYFIGREPRQTTVQASFEFDLPSDIEVSFGMQYFRTRGLSQTVGLNRLTQELIDNGTYITGFDTDVSDLNGDGILTKDEVDAGIGNQLGVFSNIEQFVDFRFPGTSLEDFVAGLFAGDPQIAAGFALDSGVGTTVLDPKAIFWTPFDFNDGDTYTAYFDVAKRIDHGDNFESRAQLRFFFDKLDSQQFAGYGFGTDYRSEVFEVKADYAWEYAFSDNLQVNGIVGTNYRDYTALRNEELGGTYVAPDRCDISIGCVASNAVFDFPLFDQPPGVSNPFDTITNTDWHNVGVFLLGDITAMNLVNVIGSVRYDHYKVTSENIGEANFGPFGQFTATDGDVSWSISGSLLLPWDVVPYITYAQSNALELGNAGDIPPGLVANKTFLQDSELLEIGINFSLLDDRVFGKLAYYDQERTLLDAINNNISGVTNEGFEAEARVLATDNFSFTGAYTYQDANFLDPGTCFFGGPGEFVTISPARVGLMPEDGFGGFFAALGASCIPELEDGYKERGVPEHTATLFGTYTSDEYSFGQFGVTFGGTYVSETAGNLTNAVTFPDYWLLRTSAFYEKGPYRVLFSATNLANKRAFLPNKSASQEVSAEPVAGRAFQITVQARF